MIRHTATSQLTTMELVIGNPKMVITSSAFGDKPCSSCLGAARDRPACSGLRAVVTALLDAPSVTPDCAPSPSFEQTVKPRSIAARIRAANLVFVFRRFPVARAVGKSAYL